MQDNESFKSPDQGVSFFNSNCTEYPTSLNFTLLISAGFERKGFEHIRGSVKTSPYQHRKDNVKFKFNCIVFPLFGGNISVLNKKIFPNWEPFFSILLNRNLFYSEENIQNSSISNPFDLAISFGAGLRLPLTQNILFDVGLRDEFGVFNNQKLYLTDIFNKNTGSLSLTLGLSYKI
ncbi:hypothetical protein ES703_91500 [subsurface metagenome]